jgi:hypothetical protein
MVDVAPGADDCWSWRGARTSSGYGNVYDGARTEKAHRIAYMITFGPVPSGLEVDHTCHNRSCVNPWHLRVVTHAANLRSSRPALASHCPRGHEYGAHRNRRGRRECLACRLIRERRRIRTAHPIAAKED